jgi:uncharacterized protein
MAEAPGADPAFITVTVVYSPRQRVIQELTMALPAGSTVAQAIEATGWDLPADLLDPLAGAMGVWGRKTGAEQPLRDLDRVEIYRPLSVDPKVARRERFSQQGKGRSGLFARRRPGAKPGY